MTTTSTNTTATFTTWFSPVVVTRGRKFKGFGYSLPGNPDFSNTPIWDPANKEIVYINPSYVERADVAPEQYNREVAEFINFRINGTIEWCKTQKPNDNDVEIRSFARNILKKRSAYLLTAFDARFPVADDEVDLRQTIVSACKWADTLVTKSAFMYGRWTQGGKPLTHDRKVNAAHKACENKGLTKDPKFEAEFTAIAAQLIH